MKPLGGLVYVLVLLILFAVVTQLFSLGGGDELPYSQVLSYFETGSVRSFTLSADGALSMKVTEGGEEKTVATHIGDVDQFHTDLDKTIKAQHAGGILESYDYPPAAQKIDWLTILPYLILGLGLVYLIVMFISRSGGGQNSMGKFTRANARVGSGNGKIVTFADVAGADEEKEELREVVEFLKEPDRFTRLGARIPKGILLVGPPGTGKTLLARAVAGEAGVQFLSISGSDFVELYVGVGAGRVRDLFEQAKKQSPAIVFIDEIDAVGRRRGAGLGGGHDEREQTLNQLLVEMDGFGQNEGVIVMAATNRKDILDPALLRPGRFDRQIYVGRPDWRGREAILKVHAKDKPLSEDVNLGTTARATAGFTGADLENLLNEAALLAARAERPCLTNEDLERAMLKVIAGPEKRSHVVTPHERRLTAVHEAGHAVVIYHLPNHDPVHQVTIVPRGGAGGITVSLPADDQDYMSRNEMFEQIVADLGGRVAEQLCLQDISTGASSDIRQATSVARDMVQRYGMSEKLGPVSYAAEGEVFIGRDYEKSKPYSERIAGDIDDEVKAIIDRAYRRCQEILTDHRDQLEKIAKYLMEFETMDRATFEQVMAEG
ncbi:MAG TPA: ATP-dependent zinc metalloprotease FtsH [Candidatus Avoscillospira stercoripullorum]|uniref:ATP-dependent zinc metalloprotease FtsH n=1 Tax=Candidatus Avoscillospira stercoripullorum TaxID=2840709 RepID=A0A9D1D7N4_9FIRM|nr:ATP-dependent zinc metalloprotease FtsH [Candidatus Avoscillospira stercoripullorum]